MTQESEILLWAARRAMGAREDVAPLAAKVRDWDAVVQAAVANSVLPLVARSLANESAVPVAVRKQLDKLYTIKAGANAALVRELHEILADLRREGIDALAYKGPALAAMAYPDLAARNPSGDLDLLLRRDDIMRAKRVAEQRGYRCILSEDDERHFLRYRYHLHMERRDPEMHVELHWALTPAYWRFPLDYWKRTRRIRVAGSELTTLDPECALLAVCAHGGKEGWPKLSQVLDVGQLIRSHPDLDWNWVLGEARRIGRERVLRLGLYLASRQIGAELPEFVAEDLGRDSELALLNAEIGKQFGAGYYAGGFREYAVRAWHRPADRFRYFAYSLRTLPGRLRAIAAPSEEDRKALESGASWKPLLFAIRPIRAVRQRGWARVISNARRLLWQ